MMHARLSPSGADRWMVCTASVPLIDRLIAAGELQESDLEGEEQISEDEIIEQQVDAYEDVILDPSRETTLFSAEGTAMHEIRANCLEFDLEPQHFVGLTISADGYTFEIDEDMADRLVEGVDWIRQHTDAPHIEQRVDLSPWLPGQYGFCDTFWLVAIRRGKFDLYVSDYKNGVGEPVAAKGNRQLRLYALGAWHQLGRPEVRSVVLNIDQPRAGGMKYDEISLVELLEFGEEARRVYHRIETGDVEFVPNSKSCRWCPVRKTARGCAAYNQWQMWMLGNSVLDVANGEPRFQDPAQMSRALRYYIVSHAPAIRQWLAKLHEESLHAAAAGDPDPGSKAIWGGEGRRYFTDEAEAGRILESVLGDDAYTKKLIGFTEIDKRLKPGRKKTGFPEQYEELQKLVDRRESKPKLVPADHPAPAYQKVSDDDFDDLD